MSGTAGGLSVFVCAFERVSVCAGSVCVCVYVCVFSACALGHMGVLQQKRSNGGGGLIQKKILRKTDECRAPWFCLKVIDCVYDMGVYRANH